MVGSLRKWSREDLYEQCSFHIAETMPSSVKVGRPADQRDEARIFVGLQPMRDGERLVDLGFCGAQRLGSSSRGMSPALRPHASPFSSGSARFLNFSPTMDVG